MIETNPETAETPAELAKAELDAGQESGFVAVGSVLPGTLADLANRQHQGVTIVEARAAIIMAARAAAIKMTRPEDWLLFRDEQGREVGYLQDCGCDRVRDVFGVDVYDVERPERQELSNGEFMYVVAGSGRSRLTQQVVESVEGGRASTDDFIGRQKPPLEGAQKELAVRKAARANLDGNITRELTGLKSVPLQEILAIMGGDSFRGRFREGRGYGTKSDRQPRPEGGSPATASGAPAQNTTAPLCPKCKVPMQLRPGGSKNGKAYGAFWGCPNFRKNGCKETLQDSEWQKQQAAKPAPAPAPPPASGPVPAELMALQKVLMCIVGADRTLDANTLCKKFFITASGQVLDYDAVAKLRTPKELKWIEIMTEKITEKYITLMPPTEPPPYSENSEIRPVYEDPYEESYPEEER